MAALEMPGAVRFLVDPGAFEDCGDGLDVAFQDGQLHVHRILPQRVHGVDHLRGVCGQAVRLLADDRVRGARLAGEADGEGGFQFEGDAFGEAERVYDDGAVAQEFQEVDAAEGGGILVLLPACQRQIDAFDVVGEAGDVVACQGQVEISAIGFDECHDQGRGGAEAGAHWRVNRRGHAHGERLAIQEVAHHPLIDAAMQEQGGVWKGGGEVVGFLPAEVAGIEADAAILAWADGGEGVAVDGGVEDGAAVFAGEAEQVGAAAGEAEAERGAGANDGAAAAVWEHGHGCLWIAGRCRSCSHLTMGR